MSNTPFPFAGALFDLDGVLLDTEGLYTRFWHEVDLAFPTGVPRFEAIIKGSNLGHILNTYFPKNRHDEIVAMLDGFQHDMRYEFFEGALEFVDALHDRGVKCAVVTSSDNKKMMSLHEQHPYFEKHFDTIVTGEMVTNPKPAPDCFLLGANLLDCEIDKCLVFEDSFNGIEAGLRSGATVVGLATTNPRDKVAERCHRCYDTISQITIDNLIYHETFRRL